MNESRTINDLRKLGVELVLSPDKTGVEAREERPNALTPEVRAAIAEHEEGFLRVLLFREAATFVSRRLEEAGLSWLDPGYDAAVVVFDGEGRQERLDEAWQEKAPESVKTVLRLCARSSVRALAASKEQAPNGIPPRNASRPSANPSGPNPQGQDRPQETDQQPTLDAT